MMNVINFFKFVGEKRPEYAFEKIRKQLGGEFPVEGEGNIIDRIKNGRFEGYNKLPASYDSKPYLSSVTYYVDDEIDGTQKYLYPDGRTAKSLDYVNGRLNGKIIDYFADGSVEQIRNYVNNVADGDEIMYFKGPENKVRSIKHWVKGKPHGNSYSYFQNGNVAYHWIYNEGRLDYEMSAYENGNIREEKDYGGRESGGLITQKTYYENGNLRQYTNFKTTEVKSYKEDGRPIQEIEKTDGKHFIMKLYHDNGQLAMIKSFLRTKTGFDTFVNVNDGELITYDNNGNIADKSIYKDGKLV
jgi:antitoxin component YwqK of YwqJK toxin-antitoxin module